MDYPRPQMRLRELMELGFSERELFAAYRSPGQKFARKINPNARNSPIVFDTAGFNAYLERKADASKRVRRLSL